MLEQQSLLNEIASLKVAERRAATLEGLLYSSKAAYRIQKTRDAQAGGPCRVESRCEAGFSFGIRHIRHIMAFTVFTCTTEM